MARILVAEDDDSMRSFLSGALRRAGHIVEPAADGFEAITLLARQEFDLIARRAARDQPNLKVMFITGFAAVALRGRSGMPGDPKILSKPFHLKDLVAQIDQLLGARPLAGA